MEKSTLTIEKMQLETQQIINRRLYERNVIDKFTYETVMNGILKEINNVT